MNINEKIKELEEKQAEILKEIEELKKEKENKFKRWRAKLGFRYFYLNSVGCIMYAQEAFNSADDYRYATGNYFETEAEALRYKQNLITYQQLKDIALRLNKGQPMDWEDIEQKKYGIHYDYDINTFKETVSFIVKNLNTIYCLDKNFLNVALSEIGEEKLKQLLE